MPNVPDCCEQCAHCQTRLINGFKCGCPDEGQPVNRDILIDVRIARAPWCPLTKQFTAAT